MKLLQASMNGIKFFYRDGTSDIKTFEEVIGKNCYQKRGNKIIREEVWHDLGANVGAFSLLCASIGAQVIAYEPDPFSCEMIEKNMKLNGFRFEIKNAAVVHGDAKELFLFAGNNNQFWRNSVVKKWNNKGIKVKCVNFDEELRLAHNVKMDIEGSEMMILENTQRNFDKLIFEWSFDIDRSLNRFWAVIDKLRKSYDVKFEEHRTCYDDRRESIWQKSWIPACSNVFCYKKTS